jgi:outer membrane protein assembly factor BamB
MRIIDKKIRLIVIVILLSVNVLWSQTQSGWRGDDRSGIYDGAGLLKVWPSSGPALLWENKEIGTGFSSVTVTQNAVYITGRKGDNDVLTAFTQDGKKNWEVIYGKASDSNYPDSRCTPAYSNGKLFLVSGAGDMVAIGTDGKIIWSVNYFRKYKGKVPQFGISESPLVVDNKVIGTPGGPMAAMVAFNADNGNVVWETPSINDGTNYVNPFLVENGQTKMIVTITEGHLIAVNPSNGKLLWNFDYEAQNSNPTGDRNHANTPIARDGCILAANGYEQVALKLKLNPGESAPSVIWKNTDLTPHVGGMVLLGNYVYSSTHDTNSKGRWICVDWTTGKTMWITNWYNKGSVISADGMLYIFEEKTGHVGLVKPGPEKLDVVSEFQITKGSGPYWAHPAIDNGRLFIRHGEYLAVYSLK